MAYFTMLCALLFIAEYLQIISLSLSQQFTLCNWAVDEQIYVLIIACNKNRLLFSFLM